MIGFDVECVAEPGYTFPEWAGTLVGGNYVDTFLQPAVDGLATLDPRIFDIVAGPVLEHVEAAATPQEYIDLLLAYVPGTDPKLFIPCSPLAHYFSAAWGAVLIADYTRCTAALHLVSATKHPHGMDEASATQIADIQRAWLERHGRPLGTW